MRYKIWEVGDNTIFHKNEDIHIYVTLLAIKDKFTTVVNRAYFNYESDIW